MSAKSPTTIFNTPILSGIFHVLTKISMALAGWRIEGKLPDLPKYILIGAPHTSNWDFVLFLGIIFSLRANVRFMGKAELFRWPVGGFFRYCGGIPVDRKRSQGLLDQIVKASAESERFILTIAPEGTRHEVADWKRGFYHIAKGAGIPIVMAKVDGIQKTAHVGEVFQPGTDIEADMKAIQASFTGMTGINPRKKTKKKYLTLEG